MNFLKSILFEEEVKKEEEEVNEDEGGKEEEAGEGGGEEEEVVEGTGGEVEAIEEEKEGGGGEGVDNADVGQDIVEEPTGGDEAEGEKEEEEVDEGEEGEEDEEPSDEVSELIAGRKPETGQHEEGADGVFSNAGLWGFGAVVKALASKSEELLREYGNEIQEFGLGLKQESEDIAEFTKLTVVDLKEFTQTRTKDLPSTLESSAHVAQESLEEVGRTIEEVGSNIWKGTAGIFAQVREAVAMVEEEAQLNAKGKGSSVSYTSAIQRGKYSRYEAQVSAMQRDSSTYCDEPEDVEEFATWSAGFNLAQRKADINGVLKDNAFMQELQSRIVPNIVEYDIFWTRYFYRLHKLQQAEDARADLVKRATIEEEELTWDVDEEVDEASGAADASTVSPKEVAEAVAVAAASPKSGGSTAAGKEVDSQEGTAQDTEATVPAPKPGGKEEIDSASPAVEPADLSKAPAAVEAATKEKETSPGVSGAPAAEAPIPVTKKDEGGHHDELASDGSSTGSEWQLVHQDDSPRAAPARQVAQSLSAAPDSQVDASQPSQDTGVPVLSPVASEEPLEATGEEGEHKEADAAAEGGEGTGSNPEKPKEKRGEEGGEEDWGEWE